METQQAWIKLGCVVLGWLPCVYMDCVLNIIGRALSEFGCVYWCCDVVVMLSYLVSRPGQKPLEALRRDPGLGL